MNKYEQSIAQLREDMELENAQYSVEAARIHNIATQYCNQFNSLTCIINVERHLMRKEIRELYRFLQNFGDLGDPITPFDFVAEDWLYVRDPAADSSVFSGTDLDCQRGYLDFAAISAMTTLTATGSVAIGSTTMSAGAAFLSSAATSLITPMILPAAIPAYMLFRDWQKRMSDKDYLTTLQRNAAEEQVKHRELIQQAKNEAVFLANAARIADLYRNVVVMIRDAIQDTILPELDGILSFLYADAIKNCIINNEDPNTAAIGKISEYRATAYDDHYQFVRNTFDYYRTITTFFTSKVMGDLLKKRNIKETDYQAFVAEVAKIEAKQKQLCASTVFGGQKQ